MNRSFSILICSLLLLTSTVTGVAQNKNTDRYYKKLQIAEKEGKYGILFRGEVVVPYEYDMITAQKDKQGFVSKQDGKSGIIRLLIYDADNTSVYHFSTWQKSYSFAKNPDDKKGKNIMVTVSEIPCEFDEIKEMNGRYLVSKGGRKGIFYYHGKEILPCEFDEIKEVKGRYLVSKGGRKGICYYHGKEILPCEFDEIKEVKGRYLVSKGGRKGICYYHGKEILPCEFDEIKEVNGRYLVSKDGRKGICYYHGKEILPCEFDKIELTPDNKYVAYKNGEKRVYTFAGSLLHTNFDRSEHPQSK